MIDLGVLLVLLLLAPFLELLETIMTDLCIANAENLDSAGHDWR